jgi:hypothetical protein
MYATVFCDDFLLLISFTKDYNPQDDEELPPPEYVEETDQPWSERTKKMHAYLDKTFGENPTLSYLGLVK